MINVGVIGTGYIGKIHIDALKRISGVNVSVVTDTNQELAADTALKFNVSRVAKDYKEIISDTTIDVIHNCTPNKYHYDITKEALEAGKHIMSEKPLAMTLQQAEELANLAESKKVVTGVNFCYRYYPLVQEMAARFRRGHAGELQLVTGTWFQDWLSKETDYSWRLTRTEGGESNTTADLGSHWFDLVQFVTGMKVKEVFGDMQTIIKERKRPKKQVLAFQKADSGDFETIPVEVEDYSSVLFHFANGKPGSFTTSQVCNGRKSDTEFQVYGSEYSMAWNHKSADKLWIGYRDKANEILTESPILQDPSTAKYATLPAGHPVGYYGAVFNLFNEYYEVVSKRCETNKLGRPTFLTGYEEMIILDAILKSVKKRTWVNV